MSKLLLLASLVQLLVVVTVAEIPIGYPAWVAEKHISGSTFTCITSNEVIDLSNVNDGYCDCKDGSDELGTGTCAEQPVVAARSGISISQSKTVITSPEDVIASFHCVNAGFRVHPILLSQVNDGYCDCCDCSDEYNNSNVIVKNTCIEKNKQELEYVRGMINNHKQGAVLQLKKKGTFKTLYERFLATCVKNIQDIQAILQKHKVLSQVQPRQRIQDDVIIMINNEYKRLYVKEEEKEDVDVLFPYPKEYMYKESGNKEISVLHPYVHNLALQNTFDYQDSAKLRSLTQQELQLKQRLVSFGNAKLEFAYNFIGDCAEGMLAKYKYKACMGVDVSQAESQHAEVSLGTYVTSKLETGKHGNTLVAEYKDGTQCWNGPKRSTTVRFTCGNWKVHSVNELAPCVYNIEATAPITCSEEVAKQLQQEYKGIIDLNQPSYKDEL